MGALEDTQAQLTELYKLREAHRQRLGVLQVRAAQFGIEAPPHITTEVEDVDHQLAEVNKKIGLLEGALPAQVEQLNPVDPRSLIPQSVVPATINERLLVLTLELMHLGDEMRRNFTALQLSQQKDTESLWHAITDTRDEIAVERDERRDWQHEEAQAREEWQDDEEGARRHGYRILSRWLWVIGAALVLLVVVVAILAVAAYVRELLREAGR